MLGSFTFGGGPAHDCDGRRFRGNRPSVQAVQHSCLSAALLYIGPAESHISEIAARTDDLRRLLGKHGDVDTVVKHILEAAKQKSRDPGSGIAEFAETFSRTNLLPRMIALFATRPRLKAKTCATQAGS